MLVLVLFPYNDQIMCINFFYMLGMSTTLFILALLLVGGLGDYLKNIFMLTQNNILVMVIGCLLSALSYVSWPLCHPSVIQDPKEEMLCN